MDNPIIPSPFSLFRLAAIRINVQICQLRLGLSSGDKTYDLFASKYSDGETSIFVVEREWPRINETLGIYSNVKSLKLPSLLIKKVLICIKPIALQIISWQNFDCLHMFPEISTISWRPLLHWTCYGTIDLKKVALSVVLNQNVSKLERCRVACRYYCLEQLTSLYQEMSSEERVIISFENIMPKYLLLDSKENIKFGDEYKVRIGSSVKVLQLVEKNILSLNEPAIRYLWSHLTAEEKRINVVKFARLLLKKPDFSLSFGLQVSNQNILCFLLSEMSCEQLGEIVSLEIKYMEGRGVLESILLFWPHQELFLSLVKFSWEFISCERFIFQLREIARIIRRECLLYSSVSETRARVIEAFKGFWCLAPAHFKLYATGEISQLDWMLDFFFMDEELMGMFLDYASLAQRRKILFSKAGSNQCSYLVTKGRWDLLDTFLTKCLVLPEDVQHFKTELCSNNGFRICISLANKGKWAVAEQFINWCLVSEAEIRQFKRELVSGFGEKLFNEGDPLFIYMHSSDLAEVLTNCLTKEEIHKFQQDFLTREKSNRLSMLYLSLVFDEQFEKADGLLRFCIPTEKTLEYRRTLLFNHNPKLLKELYLFSLLPEYKETRYFLRTVFLSKEEFDIFGETFSLLQRKEILQGIFQNPSYETKGTKLLRKLSHVVLTPEESKQFQKDILKAGYKQERAFLELMEDAKYGRTLYPSRVVHED